MSAVMKTPGVYIVEENAFPNSVVEVATAVPAFIGYTQFATDSTGKSLSGIPKRLSSMAEFEQYFGKAPPANFTIAALPSTPPAPAPAPAGGAPASPAPVAAFSVAGTGYQVTRNEPLASQFMLYYSMLLFFQNGGGACYVISVGSYQDTISVGDSGSGLLGGLTPLLKEQEPTMVVIPDAVSLANANDCYKLQQQMLVHCGNVMKSCVAILDIYDGYLPTNQPVADFRNNLGTNNLDYGMAYYPWLNANVVPDQNVSYANLDVPGLTALLTAEAAAMTAASKPALSSDVIGQLTTLDTTKFTPDLLNKTLVAQSPAFGLAISEVKRMLNLMPPSAAMAGVYTTVDNSAGVWKAPANVSLNSVISPTLRISNADQELLNVDPLGKSINAIRAFLGEGVLVWGARTLDGNSLDWRYIQVRRTMIMLQQSIELATKAYVFENNVATTWVTIKSMIRNFLTSVWKRGGLMGAVPDDAFAVFCGLGETMTPDDVLEGILRVTVLVAMIRPAEFIEITFQQQMPKS